jgi:hypothetical protein
MPPAALRRSSNASRYAAVIIARAGRPKCGLEGCAPDVVDSRRSPRLKRRLNQNAWQPFGRRYRIPLTDAVVGSLDESPPPRITAFDRASHLIHGIAERESILWVGKAHCPAGASVSKRTWVV